VDNLLKEGRPCESIFLVGNVMIDSLLCFRKKALQSRIGEELGLSDDGK
jgi:UDP-N-acetylglucosamine 2-epimerase (non-hydrolysing)